MYLATMTCGQRFPPVGCLGRRGRFTAALAAAHNAAAAHAPFEVSWTKQLQGVAGIVRADEGTAKTAFQLSEVKEWPLGPAGCLVRHAFLLNAGTVTPVMAIATDSSTMRAQHERRSQSHRISQ